jgi:hypothetical protein
MYKVIAEPADDPKEVVEDHRFEIRARRKGGCAGRLHPGHTVGGEPYLIRKDK